jgi:transcriptional regulator with XRE-family HTH domain
MTKQKVKKSKKKSTKDISIIGKTIKKKREEKEMSQYSFAERVGVSQSLVSAWENCSRVPRLETIIKIEEVLDIELVAVQ